MTFSDIIATASVWHSGMNSALYSLSSTEQIHGREHKIQLMSEIMHEIGGDGLNEETLADEKQELGRLANFVQTAPMNTDLSQCTVDDDGNFVALNNETPAPAGWTHV